MKDSKHKRREPMPLHFNNWRQGPLALESEVELLGRLYERYPNGKPDKDGYNAMTAKAILSVSK